MLIDNYNNLNYADTSYQISSSTTGTTSTNDTLGKDAFLKLLVTQLKYQDPMNPLDNNDMLAQLAQFSALEQSQNINKNLEQLRFESLSTNAVSLLGAEVKAAKTVDNEQIEKTGIVKEIKYKDSQAVFVIDGEEYSFSDIVEIKVPANYR
ncbi:MAG TPA: flagellar hook capping FlgD N-terminal domain-containing protein [bacterium]|nr:flagellar hook capping FlgD N-terminal domain-containing protein [bacterium]HOL46966.1 flagellar hook capping FlgD N-terminal domain-containing protein [bacterium]HPQ18231.1 flagellar hook capping FlgD N-terminal domain-containing protein [bacterium]